VRGEPPKLLVSTEAVGLDQVRTGREVTFVDVQHDVGPRQVEHLRAVLLAPIVPLDIQVERLDPAAHGAVAEQHALVESP
jgi:hypothetical protein